MKEITYYVADDNTTFESYEECRKYDDQLSLNVLLLAGCKFLNSFNEKITTVERFEEVVSFKIGGACVEDDYSSLNVLFRDYGSLLSPFDMVQGEDKLTPKVGTFTAVDTTWYCVEDVAEQIADLIAVFED